MSRTEVKPNVSENEPVERSGDKPPEKPLEKLVERRVLICPGFHPPALTAQFVRSVFGSGAAGFTPSSSSLDLVQQASNLDSCDRLCPLVVEAFCANPVAIFDWMSRTLGPPETVDPILAVGFSGGVVGIAGALTLWQQQGGQVAKLIAIDGWGMPLFGLPVCRVSHDWFTHWSTLPLGAGKVNFYADPPVEHLQMWACPDQVLGQVEAVWQTRKAQQITVAEFVREVLAASF